MISKFFIERPIFANVIAIVTIILGLVAVFKLPVTQYPDIVPPTIQVTTIYPGASAEVVATTVGIPIEQAVNGVENSMYMASTSGSDGSYMLTVTFSVGTDLNTSLSLVQNMVNGALSQLPETVQAQGITVRKVSTNILQVVSLYADDDRFDETFLSNYAMINLQYPLGRLPGVGQIKVVGAGTYSMRVWLDPNKLHHFNLTTMDVVNAIQQQNVQVAAGKLGGPPVPPDQTFQFTINALGRLSDISQFEDIIVKIGRDETAQIVRVKDLARVELSQQVFSNFAGLSGHAATQILVFSLPGANAIDVGKQVRQAMAEMSKDFPQGLKFAIYYDTTEFIQQAIDAVYHTLFEAGILVLIVIMVFLQNLRATLVPATTVPVTIIGAFGAMALLGFTVNLMTLFALILAIGIVVDDAIVIVENSSHYIEQGLSPKDAAIKTMSEMTGPVIGITLVLTAVFLPAAFMPGITGQLFRQFALVIASTAIISALNALTLKPAQCALWLRPRDPDKELNLFYRGFNRVYGVVEDSYVALVRWMVNRPGLMALVFVAIIGLGGLLFVLHPVGFLPEEDQGYAIIAGQLPDAASQPRVKEVSNQVDAILRKTPGVASWVTIGGFSMLDNANVPTTFSTFAIYDKWDKRGAALSQERIIEHLGREFAAIKEAEFAIMVPPPISGLGQSGGFQMMVEDRRSLGLTELEKAVREMLRAGRGQSGLHGLATSFSALSPQLYLDIDRTKAESLEIPLNDVFNTLQAYLGSSYVNLFNKFNQSYQVYVQAAAPYRVNPEDIKSLYVRNKRKEMVPLGTLLSIQRMLGSELVTRYNLYPAASIFGAPAPGFSSGQALHLMEQAAKHTLPQGMSYDWTATAYQEKQVGNQAYFIYALAIILVFLVLAAQYESWTNPAAVILVVPIALVGVILALISRNFDNNLYTQVGLVLMIALASKNAILVVEFARELHADGMSIADAAVEATRRRFRPIVMTSFAFILGVVPLMKAGGAGAASQQAIGTVVFGGMLSSTILAIPFVPVFYVITQRLSERRRQADSPEKPPEDEVGAKL
ncbi:MAG: multidrug efflux RND transporter permease subunit [Deltaproteobacteria bacterium]|nr:multidrug efflux RND transporter permease subunit [Deltaproteobacteria bacterium]